MRERGWGREESGSERNESEERMKVGTRKVDEMKGSFSNISLFRTFLSLSSTESKPNPG